MYKELIKIVHRIVLDSDISAKALAKEIGKPYSTLLREINPYDTGAKLGVGTLFDIMKHTGSVEPLAYMAEKLGCSLEQENTQISGVIQSKPGTYSDSLTQ